ncbi:hypothetical protein BCON_0309g00090 [Botryotinia convoluta]|uniref:Major facilitator superfamily (MFS) profile domain-containing protein n=1 Tax=Botryotinia convoluta TaxID=54673 RepID=A0A4Z1HDD4_9HELO|nr:hypothetical protein BCON_0309g00090 [Botryotinia convoluta]
MTIPNLRTLCTLIATPHVHITPSVKLGWSFNHKLGTAIPEIVTQFHSLNDVSLYDSAYLLTLMSFRATHGRFYTHFNIKWLFISVLVTFETGSTICATATSSKVLIIGRAISGIGASSIFSGGLTISHGLVRPKIRPLYISIVTIVYGIVAIAGPLLGGVFTDSERLTWRFCFFLNLPFGGLAILIVALQYKVPPRPQPELSVQQKLKHMDFLGAVLLLGAITCLLLASKDGGINSPWSNSKNWECLLGFGILTLCFLAIEFEPKDGPVLNFHTTAHWVGYEVLTEFGFCIGFQVPYTAVPIVLPTEDVPIGNSLPVFSQALGGALAISIAQNILTNTLSQELKIIPGLNSSEIIALGAKNLTSTVPTEYLDGVLDAYTYALSRTLILPIAAAGLAFVCSVGMEWSKVEKK